MRKVFHKELKTVDIDLPSERMAKLEELLEGISLEDINTEDKFLKTLDYLHEKIQVHPVLFDFPEIFDKAKHEEKEDEEIKRVVFVVTVRIGFKGNPLLFNFQPNGWKRAGNFPPFMFQPEEEDYLYLNLEYADLPEDEQILKEANEKLDFTFFFIKKNNEFVENWNKSVRDAVERELNETKLRLEGYYS